ncbi:MAG: tRNA glutamyl-Q(34) synthetase GluQRS [Pseudomonadota bacterium]
MNEPANGTGRFAPSPTGPLHFGSLLAAVASYLDARTANARWLLRIENIDPPREVAGAADQIIGILDAYGFEWDGAIRWQADSAAEHEAALARLVDGGLAYPCGCSRRDLANEPRSSLGTIYPGTCRAGTDAAEFAIRMRTTDEPLRYVDRLQGERVHKLESQSGDFVIKRRDGLIAYQLAVVVDDFLDNVTRIVRGIDLIDSSPRQIWLQRQLGYPTPDYAHIPVAVHDNGDKLSKLTGAPGLEASDASVNLQRALVALGQAPPAELATAPPTDIWIWAHAHWNPKPLAGIRRILPTFEPSQD